MSEEPALDKAHDPSHELTGAVVQRVFYVIDAGPYGSSPEFSTREQVMAYARERSASSDKEATPPEGIQIEVCAEFRLPSGRTTRRTLESFRMTA